MAETPLAVPFATQRHQYVYDVVTNRVFHAPEPTALVLQRFRRESREAIEEDLLPRFGAEAVHDAYERVAAWVDEEGAFFPRRPRGGSEMTEETFWHQIFTRYGINQLFLIVTEACNLRCRYCVYSGLYEGYRQHGTTNMSLETAKAAIRYYHRLHEQIYLPDKIAFINFYGGEPLLRCDLIKECVAFARSLENDKVRFSFSTTTNGTLVTPEHVDFLVDNDFHLVVSLDGPRPEHDRNRVYADGRGTYDRVLQTLGWIRDRDPRYLHEQVMLSTVYTEETDLVAVNDFFAENAAWLPMGGVLSAQRQGSANGDETSARSNGRYTEQYGELMRRYRHAKIGRARHETVFLERLAMGIRMIADRDYARSEQLDAYTGRCLPGSKIAVRPDGTLHMCERINERFPIGDVESGLDFERIRRVMEQYDREVVEAQGCATCVAQRFCPVCYAQACTEDGFDARSLCGSAAGLVVAQLSYLWSILEENPGAFDELVARPRIVDLLTAC